jgi:hypothetical protein
MTQSELRDIIYLLQRIYVGEAEQEKLFKVIKALKAELARRNKK